MLLPIASTLKKGFPATGTHVDTQCISLTAPTRLLATSSTRWAYFSVRCKETKRPHQHGSDDACYVKCNALSTSRLCELGLLSQTNELCLQLAVFTFLSQTSTPFVPGTRPSRDGVPRPAMAFLISAVVRRRNSLDANAGDAGGVAYLVVRVSRLAVVRVGRGLACLPRRPRNVALK